MAVQISEVDGIMVGMINIYCLVTKILLSKSWCKYIKAMIIPYIFQEMPYKYV